MRGWRGDEPFMISRPQIEEWAAAGESEVAEFKRTTSLRREASQTVTAMLNHRGGRVLIGVDENGRVLGQQVSSRSIEELAEELGRIDPPAFPTIDRVPVGNDREVLVVTVGAGQNRPYAYRGVAYRRVDNTTQELSRDEYNRILFERMHGEQRWENQPAGGWRVDDLDLREITLSIDEAIRRGRLEDAGTRAPQELLRGLGLTKDGQLLRAALVLFGRAERLAAEFPQCLLRVARFAGTDKTEFRDNRQFRGNVFELLHAAERFLLEHVPVASVVVPGRLDRVETPRYPPLAVREALANAFCHRDYSIGGGAGGVAVYDDRLEVTSSGALHFGLTPAALFSPHESLPWNPLIAGVFYRRGLIETWGRGTVRMAEMAAAAGLPPVEIEEVAGSVVVRFRPASGGSSRLGLDLSPRQGRVLEVLDRASDGLALREIQSRVGDAMTERQLRRELVALRSLDVVDLVGRGAGSHQSAGASGLACANAGGPGLRGDQAERQHLSALVQNSERRLKAGSPTSGCRHLG